MNHFARLLLAASLGLALASGTATAQPAAAASRPMHGASMPHDCKPMSMPMHGHKEGKEGKGMRMMSRPADCPKAAGPAASAPAHDHSTPGKNAH